MTGFVILEIEWSVNESKIWEQSLGTYLHCQLKQVIVWIVRIIVDTLFDTENLNREDWCFAMTESCFRSKQKLFNSKTTFPRYICAIVNRAEWNLRAGAGMHGIQIMNKPLHSLIGITGGLFHSIVENPCFIFQIVEAFANLIAFFQIFLIGVTNTFGHSIIEVHDTLSAMLVILIRLNGNSSQSSI